MSRYNQKK